MILILLLSIIGSSLPSELAHQIDWKLCKPQHAKCFIRKSCDVDYTGDSHELQQFNNDVSKLRNATCDTGFQVIPLSRDDVVFHMQASGQAIDSIVLYLSNKGERHQIIGCKSNGSTIELVHDPRMTGKNKPELYADHSVFGSTTVCKITIYRYSKIFTKETYKNEPFKSANETLLNISPIRTLSYPNALDFFTPLAPTLKFCDPLIFKAALPRPDWHVVPVIDFAKQTIDCKIYTNREYKLILHDGTNEIELTELECNSDRKFIGKSTNNTEIKIDETTSSVYCKTELSGMCKNLNQSCNDENCPEFTPGTSGEDPPTLSCKDEKWFLNNEYIVRTDDLRIKCQADQVKQNEAAFYVVNEKTKTIRKLTEEDKCFTKYDCMIKSKLHLDKRVIFYDENGISKMKCKEGEMRVYSNDLVLNETSYSCDNSTGLWKNNNYTIAERSRVTCVPSNRAKQEARYNQFQIGLICGCIVIVILGVAVGAFVVGMHRVKTQGKRKVGNYMKNWKKMSNSEQIKTATEIFQNAARAELGCHIHILHALHLLETIFQTGTEDPLVWEQVFPFLDRLHGASRTRGNRLTGLLTRYLYLQAKNIIDKNGWTCKNPITRKSPAGYIRAVAVRLIFYCRYNDYTEEVHKFIADGFNELRYNASDQYPHCGMLWAHAATLRSKEFLERFIKDLERLALKHDNKEIPEADRFPDIGNVCDQAAFAIGGSTHKYRKQFLFDNILCEDGIVDLGLSYIYGVLRSSNLDMGILMRALFTHKNKKGVGNSRLPKLVPNVQMQAFMEKAMRIMICYGQHQDAARVENYFMNPGVENYHDLRKFKPSEQHTELNTEQKLFEQELYKEESEIIEWLAERMDKPELKEGMGNHAEVNHGNKMKVSAPKSKGASGSAKDSKESARSAENDHPSAANSLTNLLAGEDVIFKGIVRDPVILPRIVTCPANEHEQEKYRNLLAELFSDQILMGGLIDFAPDDVTEVFAKARNVVKTEPMFIEDIPGGVTVVTDIHGQLYDLDRVFSADSVNGKPGYECAKYLFLGDYVDRGEQSLEVAMALAILKILYPDRIILLRGNHEFLEVNKGSNHKDNPKEKFKGTLSMLYHRFEAPEAEDLFLAMNEFFSYLSIAGIVAGKLFCTHGGIAGACFTRHEMRRLEKPYTKVDDDPLLRDLTWSDPTLSLKGISFNTARGASLFFGEDAFLHAMENIGCEVMIRGHQVMIKGVVDVWNRVFSVFTATATTNNNNGGVVLVDKSGNMQFRIFEVDEIRAEILEMEADGDSGDVTKQE